MKAFELGGNLCDTRTPPTRDADTRRTSGGPGAAPQHRSAAPGSCPECSPYGSGDTGWCGNRTPTRGAPHAPEQALRVHPVPPRHGPDPSPPFTQRQSSHLTSLEAVSASGQQDQAHSCCPRHAGRPCSPPSVGSLSVQHPGPDPATPVSGAAAVSEASRAWPWGGCWH